MKKGYRQLKKGYTLLETVIIITIFSLIIIVVMNMLSIFVSSYRDIKVSNRINSSAMIALDRITREIRIASSVDYINSTFNTHPGRLVLNSSYNGSPVTIDFYFDNGILKMKRGGVEIGALTRENVAVDNLIFYSSSNSISQIIRTDIDLVANIGATVKTATFYSSTVIRGGY